MPDTSKAAFVGDDISQLLALKDALASAQGAAVSRAFCAIVHSRGIAQIAADSGLEPDAIHAALADPEKPDLAIFARVADALHLRLRVRERKDSAGWSLKQD